MFQLRWLRRLIRRNTRPIPQDTAGRWKQRLSIFYAIVAWQAFGGICYMLYTGKRDWARYYGYKTDAEMNMPPGRSWAKTLGIEKATVLRISGFQKVNEYNINPEISEGEENLNSECSNTS